MHYDVDYSKLDPVAKHNKAIQDIKDYMGNQRFRHLTKLFRESADSISPDQFALMTSFAGVQGYPVKAWYNYCYPL